MSTFPADWRRRVPATVQSGQITGTLTNFVGLLTEASLPSEIFDADGPNPAQNGGGDIRVSTDEAGSSRLAIDVVSFVTDNDPANGSAEIRLLSSSIAVGSIVYVWYDPPDTESQPAVGAAFGRDATWVEAELAVLMEDTTPVDHTGNHTLSLAGGLTSIDGPFGKANTFVGNDRLSNTDAALTDIFESYDATVDVISRQTAYVFNQPVLSFSGTDDLVIYPMDDLNGNGVRVFWRDVGGSLIDNDTESLANTWVWNSFTSRASDDHEMLTNGASSGTSSATGTAGPFDTFFIGGFPATTQDWDGDIKQVVAWETARSTDYTAAQYNNESDPGAFFVAGTPVTPGAPAAGIEVLRRRIEGY